MIDNYGIHLGPLYIRFYGIILMLGVVAASYLANYLAEKRKLDTNFLWDSLLWVVVGGVFGARIWHILTPPPSMVAIGITTEYYLTHPLDALAVWRGGLGIPGAVMGGLIALYVMTRRQGQRFAVWADILAPGVALGQAIGRWGNYVNRELYGAPTDLPWAIYIPPEARLAEFADQATYHPVFFYEFLWSLGTMFLLLWLGRQYADKLKDGDIFLVYLMAYPLIRFLLEFLRLDSAQVGGLNANQSLMTVVFLLAGGALLYRHTLGEKQKE